MAYALASAQLFAPSKATVKKLVLAIQPPVNARSTTNAMALPVTMETLALSRILVSMVIASDRTPSFANLSLHVTLLAYAIPPLALVPIPTLPTARLVTMEMLALEPTLAKQESALVPILSFVLLRTNVTLPECVTQLLEFAAIPAKLTEQLVTMVTRVPRQTLAKPALAQDQTLLFALPPINVTPLELAILPAVNALIPINQTAPLATITTRVLNPIFVPMELVRVHKYVVERTTADAVLA